MSEIANGEVKKEESEELPDVTKMKEYVDGIVSKKQFVTLQMLWQLICQLLSENCSFSNESFDVLTSQVQLTKPLLVLCRRMYEQIVCIHEFMTEPLAYYAIVFDPRSIQYTVENMFYLSYLLQNGFAGTMICSSGALMVAPIEREMKDFVYVSPKPNENVIRARKPMYMNKKLFQKIYDSRTIYVDTPLMDFNRNPE